MFDTMDIEAFERTLDFPGLRETLRCWNLRMTTDCILVEALAIGKRFGFDFVGLLVDDYNKWRIKKYDSNNTEQSSSLSAWADPKTHLMFKSLEGVTVNVWDNSAATRRRLFRNKIPFHLFAQRYQVPLYLLVGISDLHPMNIYIPDAHTSQSCSTILR